VTATKFLERELAAAKARERLAQKRMDFYGRKMHRPRTKRECELWTRWYDARQRAHREGEHTERLLRKARRTK